MFSNPFWCYFASVHRNFVASGMVTFDYSVIKPSREIEISSIWSFQSSEELLSPSVCVFCQQSLLPITNYRFTPASGLPRIGKATSRILGLTDLPVLYSSRWRRFYFTLKAGVSRSFKPHPAPSCIFLFHRLTRPLYHSSWKCQAATTSLRLLPPFLLPST